MILIKTLEDLLKSQLTEWGLFLFSLDGGTDKEVSLCFLDDRWDFGGKNMILPAYQ